MENTLGETRFVTVTGDAEVKTPPDEVVVVLGVETDSKDLNQAKKDNDDIVKRFLAFAKNQGINPEHIQTDYLDIEPRYTRYEKQEFLGYFVRKSIVIVLKNTSQLEYILTKALELGVNHVQEIKFRTTQLKKFRDEARSLAIQAAKLKAQNLSKELNLTLGKPLSIEEDISNIFSGRRSWWRSGIDAYSQNQSIRGGNIDPDNGDSITLGQISISAAVRVKFEIE